MKTPISVITGFLGAGKTTLLRKIIENLNRKFAIIINEFGQVNIDGEIIAGKNVNVKELTGGCVCCSMAGEFEDAIKEIIQNYSSELIIVETTGVAEPDTIVLDIADNLENVKLDSVITVADADSMARFPQISRISKIQLEMADILILNKIDLVNEAQRVAIKSKLREYNKKAPIIETSYCDVDIDSLFGLQTEHFVSKINEHKVNFESFAYALEKRVNRDNFEKFLSEISTGVYRVKGFVSFDDGDECLVNYVAGRWELEPMKSDNKNLVFIGKDMNPHQIKAQLDRLW